MTLNLREMPGEVLPVQSEALTEVARESARLVALNRYDILDTPPEEAFDRLTRMARKLFGVPIATISFVDAHRQWHKSSEGLTNTEAPRELTFCRHVIEDNRPLLVLDASKDPRFAANPYVVGDPGVRFYASVPLRSEEGSCIGSFCLVDVKPHAFAGEEMEDLTDLARIATDELELRHLAVHDGLTGVLSRRAFRERAGRELALSRRHHDTISCIVLGFDHFKSVNDAHGHAGGDTALSEAVRAYRELLRDTDISGRLGGDEFAIVLPKTGLPGAMETAEKLRAKVAGLSIKLGEQTVRLTASFGVAAGNAATADIDALLGDAGKGLAQAKSAGGNRSAGAESPPSPPAARHRVLKSGQIVFNGGAATFNCTVRSLSEDGAGLDVSSSVGVPKRFTLLITSDNFKRQCVVTALTERHLEVAFAAA